jgi:cell cycle sensor histidine kinase DivJ
MIERRGDPEARNSQFERARHEIFITSRFAAAFFAIVFAPPILALTGQLAIWQICAVLLLVLPLATMVRLANSGRLVAAQVVSLISLVLLGSVVGLGAHSWHDVWLGWMILVPLEAALSGSSVMLLLAGIFVAAAPIAIIAGESAGWLHRDAALPGVAAATLVAPAAIYGICLVLGAKKIWKLHVRLERAGATGYRTLANVIGDLVLRHDSSGAVLSATGRAQSMFGLDSNSLNGRGFIDRVHVADRPAFLQAIDGALQRDETTTATLRLRTGEVTKSLGGDFDEPVFAWAEIRAHRFASGIDGLQDQDGAAVVSVVRNVTSAKTAEVNLEVARAEAERANSWKDRLLANVSHELRTPLNAILGFSEILGDADLSPREVGKQREYARIIHSSAEHLLSVVNLILDMSKIEAGEFEILPEPFNLEALIETCCDMLRLKAEAGQVTIVRAALNRPAELIADKRACRQILLNLLSNAVKFTEPGGNVTIGAEIVGDSIHIFVSDNGIGIAEDSLSRLGDPFFQVRSNYDRRFEGTGLGLSLVRGLVGLHGGSMRLESVAGQGTCVTVRLALDCGNLVQSKAAPTRLETAALLSRFPSPSNSSVSSDLSSVREKRIA